LGLSESGFIHYKNHGWVPLGFDPVCPDHDGDGQGMSGNDPCVPFSTDGSEYNEIAYEGVECVDEDGDGWGWQTPYKTPGRSCSTSGAIVNSPIADGDYWGWDGSRSCEIPKR